MWAAALLTLAVILYRVVLGIAGSADVHGLHNFSPLAAVALCGAIYFPRRWALAWPLGALLISDLLLNAHYRVPLLNFGMVPQYLGLLLICALGWAVRRHRQAGWTLLASLAGSVIFYVISNTGAWLESPGYAHTLSGWVQALTVGLPGYPSTLHFFRNSLLSDLLFTGLFLACLAVPSEPPPAEGLETEAA